jgi:cyclopropane fatty-acyl-phospholipid synthase-like methyltransferase
MPELWDEWNTFGGPLYPLTPLVQFVFREFDAKVNSHDDVALDLGCGSGVHTEFLARHKFKTYAVDFSDVGIANTRERLESRGLSADIRKTRVSTTNFPSNFFDLIACVDVLECLDQSEFASTIREIERLLKPQGKAFLYFCGEGDFRLQGSNFYHLRGISQVEILNAITLTKSNRQFHLDFDIQTYQNGSVRKVSNVITIGPKI